jgi:hypothetical protein
MQLFLRNQMQPMNHTYLHMTVGIGGQQKIGFHEGWMAAPWSAARRERMRDRYPRIHCNLLWPWAIPEPHKIFTLMILKQPEH